MTRYRARDKYFHWLIGLIGEDDSSNVSYEKLLTYLHDTTFRYSIRMDENRANDGIDLRYQFAKQYECESPMYGPCTVLEMMIALSFRCEETMDDATIGDRTAQWFWGMVKSLGLGSMYDRIFDEKYVEEVIENFLDRNYAPDGKGGLFTVKNCEYDLRDVEIWHQLWWYIDSIM